MEIEINYELSAGKNAEKKYKQRNKYSQKLKGVLHAIEITNKKIKDQEKKDENKKQEITLAKKKLVKIENRQKEWYEKFRYFFTQNNFLVLGGRDSKNNEVLVKKHLEEKDLYFHADIHGAPHVILKNHLESVDLISKEDKMDAAIFAGCFSSAWKSKIYSVEVYSVLSNQVSKTANTGESLKTGAFVIRGKREYHSIDLKLGIGINKQNQIVCGSTDAIKKNCKHYFIIVPGDIKKSDFAKILKLDFEKKGQNISIDQIISVLPTGEFEYYK